MEIVALRCNSRPNKTILRRSKFCLVTYNEARRKWQIERKICLKKEIKKKTIVNRHIVIMSCSIRHKNFKNIYKEELFLSVICLVSHQSLHFADRLLSMSTVLLESSNDSDFLQISADDLTKSQKSTFFLLRKFFFMKMSLFYVFHFFRSLIPF